LGIFGERSGAEEEAKGDEKRGFNCF